MSKTSLFPVQEDQEPVTLRVSGQEDRQKLGDYVTEVTENDGNREDEILEKPAFQIRRKRRRSEEEEEEEEGDDDDDDADDDGRREVKEDDDGFKTPTLPENIIPKLRQCPPAPRKPRQESSVLTGSKTASCQRRLEFSLEEIDSFITDLQRKRTTTKKNKIN